MTSLVMVLLFSVNRSSEIFVAGWYRYQMAVQRMYSLRERLAEYRIDSWTHCWTRNSINRDHYHHYHIRDPHQT